MYNDIFLSTFKSVFNNPNKLIKKLFLPAFIIVLLDAIISTSYFNNIIFNMKNQNFSITDILVILAILFTYLMSNIAIAVNTHRFIVIKNDDSPVFGSYIFSKREFKFLFTIFKFSLVIIIPSIIFTFIPKVGSFLSIILAVVITMRLSLIFPATACDEKLSLKESWNLTKNHNLLMFVMLILFPAIFTFTVSFVYSLIIAFLVNVVSSYFTIFYSFLNLFIAVFTVSVLSNIYLFINNRPVNKLKKDDDKPKDITYTSEDGNHNIKIDTKYNISFNTIKDELYEQYKNLDFNNIVYDRDYSWILKKDNDDESYISLRENNGEFIIDVKNSEQPNLNFIQNINK